MMEGVEIRDLDLHEDGRGWLAEVLREDWGIFDKPAQIYFTTVRPGVVKAWHLHKIQTDHLCCIKGTVEFGLHDARENSDTEGETQTVPMGEKSLKLIKVPPNVYHGFKNVGEKTAFLINAPTELYDYENPDEHRLPPDTNEINYDWPLTPGVQHG